MKAKKKIFVMLLMLIVLISSVVPVSAATIRLNKNKLALNVKKTYTLKIIGTNKKAAWSSSNKKIAKVDSKGKVTAVKSGTCVITAKINHYSKSCKVTVITPSIKLDKKSATITAGKTLTLKPTVKGTSKNVTWKSSDPKVATVKNGVVKAVKAGTCTISAKANGKTAKCTVTVKKNKNAEWYKKEVTKKEFDSFR